ncbi:hypothetical protein RF11_10097 [Thelohanellus kitauei]|uniref:Uncharacterized protein n=1 Tax=Thelohanellus kitauei TaxID=669202 RepID=A0A0C2I991_THEKT|nr:hypothetical protein RF11_10097 [Thelohanellus kitauei]
MTLYIRKLVLPLAARVSARRYTNLVYTDLKVPYDPNMDDICKHLKVPIYSALRPPNWVAVARYYKLMIAIALSPVYYFLYWAFISPEKRKNQYVRQLRKIRETAIVKTLDFVIAIESLFHPVDPERLKAFDEKYGECPNTVNVLGNLKYHYEFLDQAYSTDFKDFQH